MSHLTKTNLSNGVVPGFSAKHLIFRSNGFLFFYKKDINVLEYKKVIKGLFIWSRLPARFNEV